MKKPVMWVEDLHFNYDSGFSLESINTEFYSGERVAVLGSNGSGKSTFFLNLNGVLMPESGKIYFDGELITRKNINILRRGVGIVFQEPDSQMICPTVESEVAFGPLNLGISESEAMKRTYSAIERMKITHLKNSPVHYLSGGQKKSVSIADILAMKPEIIIFDEPTASLDPVSCDMFEGVLEDIGKSGITTLISTHDVDFAWRWAERIIVFDGGRIIADDIPRRIFSDDSLMERAKLRKPVMSEVCSILEKAGLLPGNSCLKSVEQLKDALLK